MTGRSPDPGAQVREVMAAYLPGYRVGSVVPVGEGLDNTAFEVNGELIVRFSKEPDAALLLKEARLLAAVADVSPVPVPQPLFTAADRGCMAYPKLPGRPLLDMPRQGRSAHSSSIAATLGGLLAALHAVPVGRVTGLVDTDDHPMIEWRREAADTYPAVAAYIPAVHHPPIEAFLLAPPPDGVPTRAFTHNDLGIEHVLVDPDTWTVTGVIDWSDASITDPARDVGLLYRDLGPAAARIAVGRRRADAEAALPERALFHARCSVLEDLAYGIETGRDPYVDKSLAALEWLFPV